MLRICIPVHNEATTIGVLLWRLRSVFQGFSREYDVVVFDDASADGTADVLEPYRAVMPLTVIRSDKHQGYAGSIDALVRHVAADDEYARRDAMVLLQGDFTESPEHLPELVKRFEGGADLVAVHRTTSDATPRDERRLRRWGRWAVKPFLRMPPVADPFTGFRLVRIAVLRDLLRAIGNRPVCTGEGWAANIDFALNVTPFARRIENVEFAPRYDVRQRASRRRGWPDVIALFHWARAARSTARPAPGGKQMAEGPARDRTASETVVSSPVTERVARVASPERGARPERGPREDRGGRPPRDGRGGRAETSDRPRSDRPDRPERPERTERPERSERSEIAARAERPAREPRQPRPPRPERPPRERTLEAAAEASGVTDELPLDAESSVELGSEGGDPQGVAGEQGAEKRARRRRRRSRRDRAGRQSEAGPDASQDSPPANAAAGARVHSTRVERDRSDEGDAGDDGDTTERDDDRETGTVEAGSVGEAARRKRRNRRRRRPRRPGDTGAPDSGAADDGSGSGSGPSAPPAGETSAD